MVGWQDSSARWVKVPAAKPETEFDPGNPHGRRDLTPTGCLLTVKHTL